MESILSYRIREGRCCRITFAVGYITLDINSVGYRTQYIADSRWFRTVNHRLIYRIECLGHDYSGIGWSNGSLVVAIVVVIAHVGISQ